MKHVPHAEAWAAIVAHIGDHGSTVSLEQNLQPYVIDRIIEQIEANRLSIQQLQRELESRITALAVDR